MTAFRIVDAEDVGVMEILKDMEKFQSVGQNILNRSRIIQVPYNVKHIIYVYDTKFYNMRNLHQPR